MCVCVCVCLWISSLVNIRHEISMRLVLGALVKGNFSRHNCWRRLCYELVNRPRCVCERYAEVVYMGKKKKKKSRVASIPLR